MTITARTGLELYAALRGAAALIAGPAQTGAIRDFSKGLAAALSEATPPETVPIVPLLQNSRLAMRSRGLTELAGRFDPALASDLPERIVAAVRADPDLRRQVLFFSGQVLSPIPSLGRKGPRQELSRFEDIVMAIGEAVPHPNPLYFFAVRQEAQRWRGLPLNHILENEVAPLVPLAFSSLMARLRDPGPIRDEARWESLQPELWLYWCCCSVKQRSDADLPTVVKNLLLVRRALMRLASPAGNPGLVPLALRKLNGILPGGEQFFSSRPATTPYSLPTAFTQKMEELWDDISSAVTGREDRLLPLDDHEIGQFTDPLFPSLSQALAKISR